MWLEITQSTLIKQENNPENKRSRIPKVLNSQSPFPRETERDVWNNKRIALHFYSKNFSVKCIPEFSNMIKCITNGLKHTRFRISQEINQNQACTKIERTEKIERPKKEN